MRKLLAVLIIAFALSFNSVFAFAGGSTDSVIVDSVSSGLIKVKYTSDSNKQVKLMVENGSTKYVYNLKDSSEYESFPLQMGNGEYKVSILENLEGNKYVPVSTEKVTVNLEDSKDVYLNSIQMIKWDASMDAVKKAKELTKNAKTDEEKINAIYSYIVKNMSYDYKKLANLKSDYLPDIDKTLSSKKGICYDYSSLFAAMLRSQGIPTKLVMGYTSNVKGYHAWNEVYVKSTGKWVTIDTTYDSQMKAAGQKVSMNKDNSVYETSKEY